ncbi:MAG TPA: DUF4870 domain-containing protein [Rhizobiaceae bacterium]|nr:DUF4870 domain-containing protein [Rhizobiaceae bacterium]
MTDTGPERPEQQLGSGLLEPGKSNIQLVYVLYLIGLAIGVSALVGVVIAYINRGKAGGWVDTHYDWAIRTFWLAVLYSLVSTLLMIVGIGFVLILVVAVWVVVRCIIGLQAAARSEAIKNPKSWLI